MGAVVKMALPLAVSALVPVALPGVSAVVTGAIAGGVSSLVTGQNPLIGAGLGALGGAVAGGVSSGPSGGGFFDNLFGAPTNAATTPTALAGSGMEGIGVQSAASAAPATAALSQVPQVPIDTGFSSTILPEFRGDVAGTIGVVGTGADAAGLAIDSSILDGDTGGPNTATGSLGIFDRVTQFARDNPKLADAAKQLAAGALTNEPEVESLETRLAGQQAALASREAELAEEQLELQNIAAREIMGEARNIDPQGRGERAAQTVLAQNLRAAQDAGRDARGSRQAALIRQAGTGAPQAARAAFDSAFGQSQNLRLAGLSAGAQRLPAGLQQTRGFGVAGNLATAAKDDELQRIDDTAGLFADFLGNPRDLRTA